MGPHATEFHWGMIRLALRSPADTAVAPAQDLFGLGSEARLNRPGLTKGNWEWRMKPGQFDSGTIRRLAELTAETGRAPAGMRP
jgi:4-alpha-glucanotransferase